MSARESNTGLLLGLWLGGLVGTGALTVVTVTLGAASIPIWGFALGALAVMMRGPLGKAIASRIGGESSPGTPPELSAEVLGELDDLRQRVFELEERVDFSERLLAQGRQAPAGGADA